MLLIPDIGSNGSFFQVVACTVGFIHGFKNSDYVRTKFHDCVMSESLAVREGASQFVFKFVEFRSF